MPQGLTDLRICHALAASPPASRSRRTRACGEPNCRSGRTPPCPHRDHTPAGFHPERCRTSREIPLSAAHHGNPHRLDPGNHSPVTDLFVPGQPRGKLPPDTHRPDGAPLRLYPAIRAPRPPGTLLTTNTRKAPPARVTVGRCGPYIAARRAARPADAAAPLPQRLCPLPGAVSAARHRCRRPTHRRTRPLPPVGTGEAERTRASGSSRCPSAADPCPTPLNLRAGITENSRQHSPADHRRHHGQCSCLRTGNGEPFGAAGAAARCGRGRTHRRGTGGTDHRLRERPDHQRRRAARPATTASWSMTIWTPESSLSSVRWRSGSATWNSTGAPSCANSPSVPSRTSATRPLPTSTTSSPQRR